MSNSSASANGERTQRVRGYLHKRFEDLSSDFPKRSEPTLKTHCRRFDRMLDKVPAFWDEMPKRARAGLVEYAAGLDEEKKTTLNAIHLQAAKVNGELLEQGKHAPTMIKLINILHSLAQSEHERSPAEVDLDCKQIEKMQQGIDKAVLTKKQRKENRKSLSAIQPLPKDATGFDPKSPPATDAEKKEWRKSYDARINTIPLKKLPLECTRNNPEFAVFAAYERTASMLAINSQDFDEVFKSRVLAAFEPLKDRPVDQVREDLRQLCGRETGKRPIHLGKLMSDPHGMLDKDWAAHHNSADPFQLMPVLLRMVIRTGLELEPKDNKIPTQGKDFIIPTQAGVPYLDTEAFAEDYKQLQLALNQKAPTLSNLVPLPQLQKTLSSPKDKKRKAVEKDNWNVEKDYQSPRSDAVKPGKSKNPGSPRTPGTTNTTTTTATTTTTTIGTSQSTGGLAKAGSQRGLVREVSTNHVPGIADQLAPTYMAAVAAAKILQEEFGCDLVFGLIKLLDSLNEVYLQLSKDELKGADPVMLAIPGAKLSKKQRDALKDACDELKKDVRKLGAEEDARILVQFFIEAANALRGKSVKGGN